MSLDKLKNGFHKFHSLHFINGGCYEDLIKNGQSPETLVIACSDSRNDPALITECDPGDIFVIRNVAALVPPYQPDYALHGTSAAIEFAVKGLKVKNIVVLGHALCGGVQALIDGENKVNEKYEFLSHWINLGKSAKEKIDIILPNANTKEKCRALEQEIIISSINNLLTFPWIEKGVNDGCLNIYGWYFDMVNGKLLEYDSGNNSFNSL